MITEKKQTKYNFIKSQKAINISEITSTFDGDLKINKTSHNYFLNENTYQEHLDQINDEEKKNEIIEFFQQF